MPLSSIYVLDGNGVLQQVLTTLSGGVHTPHQVIDNFPLDGGGNIEVDLITSLPSGTNLIGQIEISDGTHVLFTSANPGYVQGTIATIQGTSPWIVKDTAAEASLATLADTVVGGAVTVTGSIAATNPSVGTTGVTAPTSATEIGIIVSGDLVGVSSSNPIPVSVGNFPSTVAVTQSTVPWVIDGQGTAGSPTGGIVSVQGVSGGQPIPISGTITASGTTTSLQGTSPWVTEDEADVVDGTTVPPFRVLVVAGKTADVSPIYTSLPLAAGGGSVEVTDAAAESSLVTIATAVTTGPVPISGTVAATESGAWNVNQTLSTPGYEGITDGTNGPVAVKPATTTAIATDPSLVIQVSPNQPSALFTGTVPGMAPANTILVGSIYNSSSPFPSDGQTLPLQSDSSGNLKVSFGSGAEVEITDGTNVLFTTTHPGIVAGAGTAGSPAGGVVSVQGVSGGQAVPVVLNAETTKVIGTVNQGTSPWVDTLVPAASGGCLTNIQTALSDTFEEVKSSAGQLYGYGIFNPNTGPIYVAWGNSSSSSFTSATDLFYIIGIPAGGAANIAFPQGIAGGGTAIYVAASTSATSGSAPSIGVVVTTVYD